MKIIPITPVVESGKPAAGTISAVSNPAVRVIELHVLGKHVQLRSTNTGRHRRSCGAVIFDVGH